MPEEKKTVTTKPPFLVTIDGPGSDTSIECDTLAEALELVTEHGGVATLWKRMKVRLKAELEE